MSEPAPTVSVQAVSVALGGRTVLHDVDLGVGSGEVVAVLGANGSGKSTLIRAIVGLVPYDGRIALFGTPRERFRDWRRIGYVPQRVTAAAGVPATVREVVSAGRTRGWGTFRAADRAAVDDALQIVGLADLHRRGVSRLSGGQQQRVLIARALAARPDLLVLDEPLSGVDAASQLAVADAVAGLTARGVAVLVVLHETGPLAPLLHRAVVLREGRVLYDGVPGRDALPDLEHSHCEADSGFGLTGSPLPERPR